MGVNDTQSKNPTIKVFIVLSECFLKCTLEHFGFFPTRPPANYKATVQYNVIYPLSYVLWYLSTYIGNQNSKDHMMKTSAKGKFLNHNYL